MLLRFASDDRLVEQMRAGSEAAFDAIFARHHRGVLAFCRHMLGSVEEAEDAVQHTFLAAYRDLVGSDKPIQLRPWLYTIARNRCLSVLRAPERAAAADGEPSTEHLSDVVERRQDLRDLLVDVARLPDDQRAALVLAEVGGMPHDEIAAVLSVRREKVKALVFQARTALIAGRAARDTPCPEIRERLANLTGGALLRRHLRDCAGCRQYREEVRAQRRELALVLPVAPTLGLKAGVLAGAGAAAAGAGGGAGAAATGSLAAKTLVAVALAGGGAAVVETTVHDRNKPSGEGVARAPVVTATTSIPATAAAAPAPASTAGVAANAEKRRAARPKGRKLRAKAGKRRGPKAKAAKAHRVKVKPHERRGPKAKAKVHKARAPTAKVKVHKARAPKAKVQPPRAPHPTPVKAAKGRSKRSR